MPERWQQVCRVKITYELLLTICFVSTATNSIKCLVNWIALTMHVRFENTRPCHFSRSEGWKLKFSIQNKKYFQQFTVPGRMAHALRAGAGTPHAEDDVISVQRC